MVEGNFYRKGASKQITAMARLSDDLLTVLDAQSNKVLEQAPLDSIRVSERLGNTPRYIDFDNGARFDTLDNAAVDQLIRMHAGGSTGLVHWLESNMSMVFTLLVVTALFVWASIQYGVPAVSEWAAHKTPPSYSIKAGQETLAYFDRGLYKTSRISIERQNDLREQFTETLGAYNGVLPINIHFRQSDVFGANAFALPSGDIIFTDDLVDLACDDRELIAIFGHEVGHVEHRHSTRMILQSSMIGLATVLMFGDGTGLGELLVGAPVILLQRRYSREFETEADDYGLAYLQKNRIDPAYYTSIMHRLSQHHGEASERGFSGEIDSYFSTHPETEDRTEKFGPAAWVRCP